MYSHPHLDYSQHSASYAPPTPIGHRSGHTNSASSSSSVSSSFSDTQSFVPPGSLHLTPPPSLFNNTIGRPSSRGSNPMSPPSANRVRPAPINTGQANDSASRTGSPTTAGAPSPRAALVAGLRSATDRRHQKREQQREMQLQAQQQLLHQQQNLLAQIEQQQMRLQSMTLNAGLHSGGTSTMTPPGFHLSPPTSPIPSAYSNNGMNSQYMAQGGDDPRNIAALQQKFLATSALITQQQQRLQNAIASSSPSSGSPSKYDMDAPSYYNTDLSIPQAVGYGRPSSPNLPVRPSSSSAYRVRSAGQQQQQQQQHPFAINTGGNGGSMFQFSRPASGTTSGTLPASPGGSSAASNSTASSPFRRSHRKATSLSGSGDSFNFTNTPSGSGSPNYHYYSSNTTNAFHQQQGSGSYSYYNNNNLGPIGSGIGARGSAASGSPARQPIGPPPLEELKTSKRGSNFAVFAV